MPLVVTLLLVHPPEASADILRGLLRVVGGVLEVPRSTLAGTVGGPPILGTLAGALTGVVRGAGMIVGGTLETALSAIPFAAKLAPYIPVFL